MVKGSCHACESKNNTENNNGTEVPEGKIVSVTSSISSAASILGSWQVCHSICLGIVALLAVIGITVVGMPLQFLIAWAMPLWFVALVLFTITLTLHIKRGCITRGLIMLNSGLLIAGVPFKQVERFLPLFWIVGGVIALLGIILIIQEKRKKTDKKENMQNHQKFKRNFGVQKTASFRKRWTNSPKRSKSDMLLFLSLIIIIGAFFYTLWGLTQQYSTSQTKQVQVTPINPPPTIPFSQDTETMTSGTTNTGDVSIALTPEKNLNNNLIIRFAANTHSVDLSQFDLTKITLLEYDGKKVQPKTASTLNGHHSSGIITFNPDSVPQKFKITIKGIPLIEERTFEWT